MPSEVVKHLHPDHEAWSAYEAHLEAVGDDELLAYAENRDAILITTNKDCAALARRLCCARVIYLAVIEANALEAVIRAIDWLERNEIPAGRVIRVTRRTTIRILNPSPWK